MPSREPVRYARPAESIDAMAFWTLQPLAWMAQGAAMWGLLGLSALAGAAPVAPTRPRSR